MATTRRKQLFLIGTTLVIAMVASYSFLSDYQRAEETIQNTSKADSGDPKEGGKSDYLNNTDFPLVLKEKNKGDAIILKENIQRERRKGIANACRRYNLSSASHSILNKAPTRIIVDHEHKFMFCFIPKVACTSWKRIFLVLKGIINDIDEIDQFEINHRQQMKLDFFYRQSRWMKKYILENYTKIMFARHPMSRVLSAYMNKLAPNTTFTRARGWQKRIGRKFMKQVNGLSHLKPDSRKDLTFADFVKYVGSAHEDNSHWREMYKMCSPCNINYDIIGKFETIAEDAEYVLETLNISDIVQFPSSNGSSPTNSSDHVIMSYTNVPNRDVRNLYRRYQIDFDMFGYDVPYEIRRHLS